MGIVGFGLQTKNMTIILMVVHLMRFLIFYFYGKGNHGGIFTMAGIKFDGYLPISLYIGNLIRWTSLIKVK